MKKIWIFCLSVLIGAMCVLGISACGDKDGSGKGNVGSYVESTSSTADSFSSSEDNDSSTADNSSSSEDNDSSTEDNSSSSEDNDITYTVTWKNYNGTDIEIDENVPYGTMPTYNGAIPEKMSTAQYTYTFDGWSPSLSVVKGDVVYTAQFTQSVRAYTVTWKNYDGTDIEIDENVPYGEMPTYNGAIPEKMSTAQYTYTFDGWSPSLSVVKGDVVYTAQFTQELRWYAVTSVSLSSTTLSLAMKDTSTLVANVFPSNASNPAVTWSSSNPSVASVENGLVTAHKVGSTTITVTTADGNKTATCEVTVVEAGSIEYKLTSDYSFYYVYKVTGTLSSVSIPKEYDDLRVVAIGANAFKDNTYVKTVTIPNTIERIEAGAFQNCTGLTQIHFPDSITSIGNNAFNGCTALETVTLNNTLTSIGDYAFNGCTSLETIHLGSTLETMGMYAFSGCTALQNITLPASLKTMGVGAFRKATALQSVTLATGLNAIPNIAFQGCTALKKIDILANISSIGNSSFSDCTGLQEINILGDITRFGNSAFYLCENVTKIYYNSSLSGEFGTDNYILYNVGVQGEGVTFTVGKNGYIPNGLFTPYQNSNYPKIKAIHIEKGATTVNYLTEDTPLPYLTEVDLADSLVTVGDGFIDACAHLTTVQNGITYLDTWAVRYDNTTSDVTLKTGTTKTNGNIFQEKTALRSIQFADSYTVIPVKAFYGCANLSSVELGQVESIGEYAFGGCTSLSLIVIPQTVTTMGQNVFYNCSNLKVGARASEKPDGWHTNWLGNAYVVWGYQDSYTVTFQADGQIIGTDTYTVTNPTVTEPAVPEKPYYKDGAWENYTLTHGDITVNAVYTPIEYTVTFQADGATVSTPTYTVENTDITVPSVPEKIGYEGVWESYTLDLENITVNAVYTPIVYTITYVDELEAENDNPTTYTVESETITLLSLEKTGYVFVGWYDNGALVKKIYKGSHGDKTLTAKWIMYISKKEDLTAIKPSMNYILQNDIDLGGMEWTPIGNSSTPFAGVFEGNGYTISNFQITTGQQYVGLFGYNQGTIKNLGVTDFTIDVSYSGTIYAGGLVGYNSGTITGCYTTGDVTASSSASSRDSYAGGLVGYHNGTLKKCYATGNVTATNSSGSSCDCYAGGLVGRGGTISNCYATGNVTASSSTRSAYAYGYAGGLAGYSEGISSCYATGDVTVNSGRSYAGGLAGYSEGIGYCYATGNVTAQGYSFAGGLVGYNNSESIIDCYATGNVRTATGANYRYAGGLVGYNNGGTISNCFRYKGQTVSGNPIDESGLSKTMEELTSLKFQTSLDHNTLNWSTDVWNCVAGQHPTLKWQN